MLIVVLVVVQLVVFLALVLVVRQVVADQWLVMGDVERASLTVFVV